MNINPIAAPIVPGVPGGIQNNTVQPVNVGNTTIEKMNLYQKINKVMQTIKYLQKDGQVSFNSTRYRYLSEEKITTELRQACKQYGLVIFPIEAVPEKIGNITQVVVKYKIVDIDTGDSEILSAVGQGADSQDKGAAKAMTMAFKYMERQTFMIPSGDDPDQVSSPELDNDPNLQPYTKEQIARITTLSGVLKWTKVQNKEFAERVCGTGDFSLFTMAMANKLIIAMEAECKK